MKCTETACEHGATHAIKLCVPATGYPQDEARAISMVLGVRLCRKHAEAFKPEQLIDVPNEKGSTLREAMPIIARLHGSQVPPDCDRAWIVPLRLDSEAFLTFERVSRQGGGDR